MECSPTRACSNLPQGWRAPAHRDCSYPVRGRLQEDASTRTCSTDMTSSEGYCSRVFLLLIIYPGWMPYRGRGTQNPILLYAIIDSIGSCICTLESMHEEPLGRELRWESATAER